MLTVPVIHESIKEGLNTRVAVASEGGGVHPAIVRVASSARAGAVVRVLLVEGREEVSQAVDALIKGYELIDAPLPVEVMAENWHIFNR
ncbi:hypothetical protein [Kineococcus arenarius]|uniref:hypothetical protein n=1 Tax=Kineococcus sp. SYSU DK007 TaxID=3383128 RepID=UPI003D7E80BB